MYIVQACIHICGYTGGGTLTVFYSVHVYTQVHKYGHTVYMMYSVTVLWCRVLMCTRGSLFYGSTHQSMFMELHPDPSTGTMYMYQYMCIVHDYIHCIYAASTLYVHVHVPVLLQ